MGIQNAFKFYGGVPKRILFDNMSTVIDTNVKPKRVNHKMVQFAKDMNFREEIMQDQTCLYKRNQ